jgi:hypothetical protein
MRNVVVVLVGIALGCRREPLAIQAELPAPDVALSDTNIDAVTDAPTDAETDTEVAPIPTRTATRTRFSTHALTMAEHGIDGTFELWRDSRLDDKRVDEEWFGGSFSRGEVVPGFEASPAASAQLVLRDARRLIVESLDLQLPVAKMTPVRFGDDVVPYFEVAIDTYAGAGRWGGTTHKFVRVEGGRSRWLDCAETYRCALGCRFHFDPRPGGGVDILEWRHWYANDAMTPITNLSRIEVKGGACDRKTRTVKGWLGEEGSGTAIVIPKDFPERTGAT